jgi:hypothetical protein
MAASIFQDHKLRNARHVARGPASSTLRLRSLLGGLCLAAAAGGAWLGSAAGAATTEPDLVRLLQAMGLIKVGLAVAGIAAVFWRFSWPTAPRIAAAYVAGASLTAAASVMIVNLAWIPTAALVFHVGAGLMIAGAVFDESGRGRAPARQDRD